MIVFLDRIYILEICFFYKYAKRLLGPSKKLAKNAAAKVQIY